MQPPASVLRGALQLRAAAAKKLGISRFALIRLMQKHDIKRKA